MNCKKILIASMIVACSLSLNEAGAKKITAQISKNYVEIDKLIEYNNFSKADSMLNDIIAKNPKDIDAKALKAVSLAKQYKLDPAQSQITALLKQNPNNPDLHYAQGVINMMRTTSSNVEYIKNADKLNQDAIKEFKKAISFNKDHYRAYNAMGVASLKLGKTDDAKIFFKKALEIEPQYSTAIDNLGTLDLAEGNLNAAEKKFQQSLKYNSKNPTAMFHLAQVATQKQQYSRALTLLNDSLALHRNASPVYNLMGEVYELQGNEAAAISSYRKSIAAKPENTAPYLNLAALYEKRSDAEFAIEQLKTALSVNPNLNEAKVKIADIALANGKYSQAIENYYSLIGIEGYSETALKGIANAYFEQAKTLSYNGLIASNRDFVKAYDYVNKALIANPNDLELYLAKLKLAKITNQPRESIEVLNRIIKSPADGLGDLVVKGDAYYALDNYAEAKKTYDLAINSTKTIDDDLYLAEVFTYNKHFDAAKSALQNALLKNPKNREANNNLEYIIRSEEQANYDLAIAKSLLKQRNRIMAREYLSRAIAINPENAQANYLLAQLFEKEKFLIGARDCYSNYLMLTPNAKNKKKIERKIQKFDKKIIKKVKANAKEMAKKEAKFKKTHAQKPAPKKQPSVQKK